MEEILGYVLSKFLDVIVHDLRAILGNWGCLMVSILAAGVLFWFVPAYLLDLPGHDWKTWLVVGPLATIAVVIMVAGTYGLTRGGRAQSDEPASGGGPDNQEPATWSTLTEPFARDIEVLTKDIPETIQRTIEPGSKECPHCGERISARATVCRFCGHSISPLGSGASLTSDGQGANAGPPRAGPGGEPTLADTGDQTSVCTHCGARNPTDSAFCGECGAGLGRAEA